MCTISEKNAPPWVEATAFVKFRLQPGQIPSPIGTEKRRYSQVRPGSTRGQCPSETRVNRITLSPSVINGNWRLSSHSRPWCKMQRTAAIRPLRWMLRHGLRSAPGLGCVETPAHLRPVFFLDRPSLEIGSSPVCCSESFLGPGMGRKRGL